MMKKIIFGLALVGVGYLVVSHAQGAAEHVGDRSTGARPTGARSTPAPLSLHNLSVHSQLMSPESISDLLGLQHNQCASLEEMLLEKGLTLPCSPAHER